MPFGELQRQEVVALLDQMNTTQEAHRSQPSGPLPAMRLPRPVRRGTGVGGFLKDGLCNHRALSLSGGGLIWPRVVANAI